MDALYPGSLLGRYELLVRLGRGAMASVWVARDVGGPTPRLLAVKAMLPELAQNSDFRAMFLEEGQIIRSIDHPNVVKVHDVGEEQGVLFMAMDWIEGDSLRALMQEARRRRPIPIEIAVRIIADAAAGLHAAHELRGWDGELRQVVHCDVSPHNILVGIDGRARILDFGVANARLHSDITADEKVKGKFAYMSPEQAEGRPIDRRSDVFALGIVLFELTTGERLFRGEGPAHTLTLVTSGRIPDPREVRPDYPARLAAITRRALERDPDRRFPTAQALQQALERYLVEERTLVSQSSVAMLVRRVLGSRVDMLRQSVREALVVQDGALRAGLVSESNAAIGTFTGELPRTAYRQSAYSSTPRPQSYEPEAPRAGWGPLVAALGGIAAATSSIVWVTSQRSPEPAPAELPSATLAAAAPLGAPLRSEPGAPPEDTEPPAAGLDVASIPVGEASARSPAAGGRGSRRRARTNTSAAQRDERSEPVVLLESAPAASAAAARALPVVLDEASPAATAERVQLEDEPAPATSTPASNTADSGPRGPFNRGAALAQLGSVASRAASCKRPNGPSGSGRATVTFSPDGRAAKVVVGAPFSGTEVGQCVTNAFQSARVPAFTGGPVTLPWTFRISE